VERHNFLIVPSFLSLFFYPKRHIKAKQTTQFKEKRQSRCIARVNYTRDKARKIIVLVALRLAILAGAINKQQLHYM
jgi:hypothetical protein